VSRRNLDNGRESPRSTEVSAIPRQVDLRVHDDVALDEIELYAEVLSAVAASDGPLSPTELDAVLGVRPICGCTSLTPARAPSRTPVHHVRAPEAKS